MSYLRHPPKDVMVFYAKSRGDPVLSWLCDPHGHLRRLSFVPGAPNPSAIWYKLDNGSRVFAVHLSKQQVLHGGLLCTKPVNPPPFIEKLAQLIGKQRSVGATGKPVKPDKPGKPGKNLRSLVLGVGFLGGAVIAAATQHRRIRSYFKQTLEKSKTAILEDSTKRQASIQEAQKAQEAQEAQEKDDKHIQMQSARIQALETELAREKQRYDKLRSADMSLLTSKLNKKEKLRNELYLVKNTILQHKDLPPELVEIIQQEQDLPQDILSKMQPGVQASVEQIKTIRANISEPDNEITPAELEVILLAMCQNDWAVTEDIGAALLRALQVDSAESKHDHDLKSLRVADLIEHYNKTHWKTTAFDYTQMVKSLLIINPACKRRLKRIIERVIATNLLQASVGKSLYEYSDDTFFHKLIASPDKRNYYAADDMYNVWQRSVNKNEKLTNPLTGSDVTQAEKTLILELSNHQEAPCKQKITLNVHYEFKVSEPRKYKGSWYQLVSAQHKRRSTLHVIAWLPVQTGTEKVVDDLRALFIQGRFFPSSELEEPLEKSLYITVKDTIKEAKANYMILLKSNYNHYPAVSMETQLPIDINDWRQNVPVDFGELGTRIHNML